MVPPEGSPPDSPDEVGLGAYSERELDEMLLQAASLASELADEKLPVPEPLPAKSSDSVLDDNRDTVANVDAELAHMEQLMGQATSQLEAAGETPAEAPAPGADAPVDPGAPPPTESTAPSPAPPADMDEDATLQPDEQQLLESVAQADQPGAPAASAGAGDGIGITAEDLAAIGGAGSADAIPDLGDGSEPTPEPAPLSPPGAAASAAPAGTTPAERPPLLDRLLAACLAPVLRLLNLLDAPFRKVPLCVKQILGYLGLATLGTAIVALLFALL